MKATTPHSGFSIQHFTEWAGFYVVLIIVLAVVGLWASHKILDHTLPPGDIKITTSKSSYKVGESVQFTLVNKFPTTIYVNNGCPDEPLSVYKWDGKKWNRVHDTAAAGSCNQQQRLVAVKANSSIASNYDAWHHLFDQPGTYRIVAAIEHYEGLPYTDFVITDASSPLAPSQSNPQTQTQPDNKLPPPDAREREHLEPNDD